MHTYCMYTHIQHALYSTLYTHICTLHVYTYISYFACIHTYIMHYIAHYIYTYIIHCMHAHIYIIHYIEHYILIHTYHSLYMHIYISCTVYLQHNMHIIHCMYIHNIPYIVCIHTNISYIALMCMCAPMETSHMPYKYVELHVKLFLGNKILNHANTIF